jgi:3-deoxy-D-manno-octulosonic-acid transferase
MHPLLQPAWTLAGWAAELGVALAPAGGGKLARTFALRRGAVARIAAWAAAHRDVKRPLLWMHAPSVGEGLMARPVLELVRTQHPDWQVAYTFFSPSAERFAAALVPAFADIADVLPFDTRTNADALLRALRPSALCFAKLDVWPMLVERAVARGVRVGLVSASVPERSGRMSPLARASLGDAYRALSVVGAVDDASAKRLTQLGVAADAVRVTGDTRYDQVLARVAAIPASGGWRSMFSDERPTVVAGSTWPSDESVLMPAWAVVRVAVPGARLLVAPHEPTTEHLEALERLAGAQGWRVARLGSPDASRADVVLVDRVGVLADLYAVAQVAMVGGGFHDAGLHSVVEPAALGVPVVCGPRDAAARDAVLLAAGGGLCRCASAGELADALLHWLTNAPSRHDAVQANRAVVETQRGAASRSAALVERLVQAR